MGCYAQGENVTCNLKLCRNNIVFYRNAYFGEREDLFYRVQLIIYTKIFHKILDLGLGYIIGGYGVEGGGQKVR